MMRKLSVGNDQIWQRVAANLTVHYNQFVTEVGLSDGKITVRSKSGESYQCDKLIWAGRLPALGKALGNQFEQGSSPASQRHYAQISMLHRTVHLRSTYLISHDSISPPFPESFTTSSLRMKQHQVV